METTRDEWPLRRRLVWLLSRVVAWAVLVLLGWLPFFITLLWAIMEALPKGLSKPGSELEQALQSLDLFTPLGLATFSFSFYAIALCVALVLASVVRTGMWCFV